MTVKVFLRLVDIEAKLASLFPFIMGVLFSLYYFQEVKVVNTLLFLAGLLPFSMTTTVINHYMDYKKSEDEDYRTNTNIIGKAGLSTRLIACLIGCMLVLSGLIGAFLTYRTDVLLLILGGWCFFIGIFYTYGPVPLSRMPLGEVFSGVTEGLVVFLISIYVNVYDQGFLQLTIDRTHFSFSGDLSVLAALLLASLPMVFTIANVMLANNICDLEEDQGNHRYTLPFYIGKQQAIRLFHFLMYACYAAVTVSVLTGVYSPVMLIVFLTLPAVRRNLNAFSQEQVKSRTFIFSIKNLLLFNGIQVIGLMLSLLH